MKTVAELSNITQLVRQVLVQGIEAHNVYGGVPPIDMLPPDKMEDGKERLSLFLYHTREQAAARNMPPRDPSQTVKNTPMGLQLYYQLTAHPADKNTEDKPSLHDLFGSALKAVHDVPLITAAMTEDFGVDVAIEQLEISLLNIPVEEAGTYWTAGSEPRRLAAHLEVGVVFLEAEPPAQMAVPVLEYGVFTEAGMGVVLDESLSRHVVNVPGRGKRKIEFTPARVAHKEDFLLRGRGWGGGPLEVVLHRRGDDPYRLASDAERRDARSTAQIRVELRKEDKDEPLLPGMYSVTVTLPNGSESNRVPLLVRPVIDSVKPDTDNDADDDEAVVFKLDGGPFRDDDVDLSVELFVGDKPLRKPDDDDEDPDDLEDNEFIVADSSTIYFKHSDAPDSEEVKALRVVVDQVEGLPKWWEVEA